MTWFDLPSAEEAAYDAPFPSREYMAGPRTFPRSPGMSMMYPGQVMR